MEKESDSQLTAGQCLSIADLLDAIKRAEDEIRALKAKRAELAKQLKTVKKIESDRVAAKYENLLMEIADGESMAILCKKYGVGAGTLYRKANQLLRTRSRETGFWGVWRPYGGQSLGEWLKANRDSLCI
jgi:hypothetical protein